MNLFRELTRKPWLTKQGRIDDVHDGGAFALPTATLGLRVFLAVVTVLFSLLVVAYADRMAFADWRSLPDPWLLWLNTAILISSSVAFQQARIHARLGQLDGLKGALVWAGVLTLAFLIGQLLAWQKLVAWGYFAATNPANAFFYLVTGLHGLHMLGGLVVWGDTTNKVWRGGEVAQVRSRVELCAVYWHYLLAVWLVLFSLLLLT